MAQARRTEPVTHLSSFWRWPTADNPRGASPAQRRFRWAVTQPKAKVNGFIGGIGSGKTAVGAQLAYELAAHYAPGRISGIVVPSYQTFHQATMPEIRKFWPPEELTWHHRKAAGDEALVVFTPQGDSEIQIRSAQDAGTLEKIRGPSWAWCWGDEVGTWALWEMAFDLVIGRLRGDLRGLPLKFPVFYFTGSPRWHLAKKLSAKGKLPPQAWTTGVYSTGTHPQERIYLCAAQTESNANNPDGYVDFLRAQYGEAFAQQELTGDFVAPSQAVFPGFYRSIHVIPDEIAERLFRNTQKRVGAVDWGFSSGAQVVGGFDSDDRLIIPPGATWSRAGVSIEERGEKAREWIEKFGLPGPDGKKRLTWYVPPDDAEAVNAWMGRLKDHKAVQGTEKARNERKAGWDSVRHLMRVASKVRHPADGPNVPDSARRPGSWIYIAEGNSSLIDDIQGLQHPPPRPGEEIDEDKVVGSAHYPDALRYLVYSALYGTQPKGQRANQR